MRGKKHAGRLALALLSVAVLVVPAYPLTTEDLDIIWSIPGDTSLDFFGSSLASGDVNGDGVPDIVVASDTFDWDHAPYGYRGIVNVYYGDRIGDSVPDLRLRSPVWKGSNTPRLACGDLNGDGYADIVMGEDMAGDCGVCAVWMGGNPVK